MNPYLAAFEAYHAAGEPFVPWVDALDFHLQCGTVVSRPDVFVMARPVRLAFSDACHACLVAHAEPDAWHVWAAAGDLAGMLREAGRFGWVTFQRRTGRVHRWRIERMARAWPPVH